MAGAYVQAQKVDTSGTSGGITITLTAGNNVYVWVRAGGTVTPSVADTLGNTYNPVARDGSNNWPLAPDVDTDTVGVYEALNVAGGATTITVSTGSSVTQRHIATEVSGLTLATAVDKAAFTDSQATTTPTSGATATRTQADEFLLGFISSSGTSPGFTAGSGFTKALAETTKSAVEWQVVSVTGTDAGTWTMGTPDPGGAGNVTIAAITTLKAAGAAIAPNDRPANVPHRTGIGPKMRRAFAQRYPDSQEVPVELTQSPAAPFRPGRGPGMGPMLLRRNLVWPSATYSPDVTLALTGVQATGSVGTLGVQHDQALTGNAATGAVGSLAPSTSVALTGVSATGSVGTLAPSADVALTGVAGTGSVGTLAPSTTVTLTGNEATVSLGTLTPSVSGADVTVALTGVSATALLGDLSPSGADVPSAPVQPNTGGGSGVAWQPIQDRYWRQIELRYRKKKKQAEKKSERAVELIEEIARRGDDLEQALQVLKVELAEEHIRQSKVYVELLKLKLELAEADEEEDEAMTLLASEEYRL